MRYLALFTVCLFIVKGNIQAQSDTPSVEELLQGLVQPDEDAPAQLDDLYDYYAELMRRPLNLNKATETDLYSLRLLSHEQVNAFFIYRQQFGKLLSIYELQAIPSWDISTIRQLLPLVRVGSTAKSNAPNLKQSLFAEGNQQVMLRSLKKLDQPPFPDSLMQGRSQAQWYLRVRSSYSKLYSIGLTLEQDAGELWKPDSTQLPQPDFASFHAVVHNQGKLKALAIGDYQIQLGQSLLMAGGFQLGKGSATVAGMRRSHTGIRPYTSSSEFGYLRGIAGTYSISPTLALTSWISKQKIDAKVDTLEGQPITSSLPETGYHLTATELKRKNVLSQWVYGGNLSYQHPKKPLEAGITAMAIHYPQRFSEKSNLYQQPLSSSNSQQNLSLHYSWQWKQWQIYGESGGSYKAGKFSLGHISGIMGGLGRKMQIALLYRYYSPSFDSPFGNSIAESSKARNETGWYLGLKYSPSKKWQLQAYLDQFRFPWLRYRVDAPSSGYEQLLRLTYSPSRHALAYVQYKEEKKARNLPEKAQEPIGQVIPLLKRQWQFHARWSLPTRLTLQLRAQGSALQIEPQTSTQWGWSVHQELSWSKGKVKLSARTQYFETDSYDARQYVYEKDVLYAYSFPAFHGRGIRQYVMGKIRVLGCLDFWLKYAQTLSLPATQPQRSIRWQLLWKF